MTRRRHNFRPLGSCRQYEGTVWSCTRCAHTFAKRWPSDQALDDAMLDRVELSDPCREATT